VRKKREFEELGISEFRWKCVECARGGRATDEGKKESSLFSKKSTFQKGKMNGLGSEDSLTKLF
jgi:hypothetical protein